VRCYEPGGRPPNPQPLGGMIPKPVYLPSSIYALAQVFRIGGRATSKYIYALMAEASARKASNFVSKSRKDCELDDNDITRRRSGRNEQHLRSRVSRVPRSPRGKSKTKSNGWSVATPRQLESVKSSSVLRRVAQRNIPLEKCQQPWWTSARTTLKTTDIVDIIFRLELTSSATYRNLPNLTRSNRNPILKAT